MMYIYLNAHIWFIISHHYSLYVVYYIFTFAGTIHVEYNLNISRTCMALCFDNQLDSICR